MLQVINGVAIRLTEENHLCQEKRTYYGQYSGDKCNLTLDLHKVGGKFYCKEVRRWDNNWPDGEPYFKEIDLDEAFALLREAGWSDETIEKTLGLQVLV